MGAVAAAAVAAITIEGVAMGAAIGAAMGGISAAIQGGDIGMGILGGGLGGGLTAGMGAGLGSAIGAQAGTFGGVATGALSTAAGGAVNAGITGADPMNGALMGAVTGGLAGGMGAFETQAAASGLDSAASSGVDAVGANQVASGEIARGSMMGPLESGATRDSIMSPIPSGAGMAGPVDMAYLPAPDGAGAGLNPADINAASAALKANDTQTFLTFSPEVQAAANPNLAQNMPTMTPLGTNVIQSAAKGGSYGSMQKFQSDNAVYQGYNPIERQPGVPDFGDADIQQMTYNPQSGQFDGPPGNPSFGKPTNLGPSSNLTPVSLPQGQIPAMDPSYIASISQGGAINPATAGANPSLQNSLTSWGSTPINSLWGGGASVPAGAVTPAAAPWGTTGFSPVDSGLNWIQNNKMLAAGGGLSLLSALGSTSGSSSAGAASNPTGPVNKTFSQPLQQYGYLQPGGNVTQFRQVNARPSGLSAGQSWGYTASGQMVPVTVGPNGQLIQAMKEGGRVHHGGQDDVVPILGAAGEYMIPADVVSGLGDGYSDAGAKKLDDLVSNVRSHKGAPKRLPKKSKPTASGYLRSA